MEATSSIIASGSVQVRENTIICFGSAGSIGAKHASQSYSAFGLEPSSHTDARISARRARDRALRSPRPEDVPDERGHRGLG
jgi:hypothetical protein